jgi:hypothetical protein
MGLRWVSMGARSPHGVGTLPGCTALAHSTAFLGLKLRIYNRKTQPNVNEALTILTDPRR